MKTSAEFAQAQLDRARQLVSRRLIITPAHIGELVTLAVQGDGNMLTSRPAMIYNVNACTLQQAQDARKLLSTKAWFDAVDNMDEDEIKAYVNAVLNGAQLSFTVPLTSSSRFSNREIVTALVSEYDRKATEENPTPGKGIGLDNVTPKKAVALDRSNMFNDWDDDATLEDASEGTTSESEDPFADDPATEAEIDSKAEA